MPPLYIRDALLPNSPLQGLLAQGLGALLNIDRPLIAQAQRDRVGDSLDLDAASRAEHPSDHRWDYILSVPDAMKLVGVEPHRARDSEISVVISKKRNAEVYLRTHLAPRYQVSRWFWVSHSNDGFSRMERAHRQLAQNGISYHRTLSALT